MGARGGQVTLGPCPDRASGPMGINSGSNDAILFASTTMPLTGRGPRSSSASERPASLLTRCAGDREAARALKRCHAGGGGAALSCAAQDCESPVAPAAKSSFRACCLLQDINQLQLASLYVQRLRSSIIRSAHEALPPPLGPRLVAKARGLAACRSAPPADGQTRSCPGRSEPRAAPRAARRCTQRAARRRLAGPCAPAAST